MDSSAIAWTAMILVVVFLTLTFAPNWSLAILILVGKIAQAFDGKKTANDTANAPSGSGSGPGPDLGPGPPPDQGLGQGQTPDQGQGHQALQAPRGHVIEMAAFGYERTHPESSSTTSTSSATVFEVFLNFHGPDTRATITSYLHNTLVKAGISVFLDDEELHYGEIQPQLIRAIQQSKVSIVIFSTDYASKKLCLMELVEMWDCRKTNGQTIIPIFYNVSPSDVRKQEGDFGRAFSLHEKIVDSKTIEKWREVLRDIGDLPGHSGKLYEGYENQLVEEVVLRVARILRDDGLAVTDELVGIDLHVQEMMRKLGVAPSEGRATKVRGEDVCIVGICGVPGVVGKTTLAKVIYNEVHTLFEGHSFLEGISARGVRVAQPMLIADLLNLEPAPLESVDKGIKEIARLFRNKKVLIVLDDVDEDEQIKALAGKPTWFGSGSRIIVTTNNKKVLSAFDVGADGCGTVEEHEIEPMSDDHALQLFRYHAFQGNAPEEVSEYDSLSKDIVKAIGRVSKDIVHHASNLGRDMSMDSWRSTLELLQERGRTGGLPKSVVEDAPASAVDASAPAGKPDSSLTTSSSSGIKYGVYLNFSGTDTDRTITSHLHKALINAGISVFPDKQELGLGEIKEQAQCSLIKQSRISIAILSKDFASNEWCLQELVEMWDCRKTNGQTIIPIFSDVSPSDVKRQEGDFGNAFSLHEERVDSKIIEKWSEVLRDVGSLHGFSGKLYEGDEARLVEEVVKDVKWTLRNDGLLM